MPPVRLGLLLGIALAPAAARGDDPAGTPEFFEIKVRPVLVEHCQKCHGDAKGKEPKGGLRVDGRAALLKGGDSGPAIVPGDPDKSRLIEAVRFANADLQMPPKGKLTAAAVADLTAWVKAGAVWPNDREAVAVGPAAFDLEKRKREHWAWQPVRPQTLPAVRDGAWPVSSADKFILAALEAKNLKPAPGADRRVWIRRVTFDLIGLPPTPTEVEAYLADRSTEAERRVVDRLLDSPHFGERWGRHWLDLVRYAETHGHEFDPPIPNAFEYRDYVIRALNADVPYNQFLGEHVAGDLLPVPRLHPTARFNESILGTGFWFLGEAVHSPVDIRQDQADRFDNRIDVLTKTFLGLTVACARCHDHKFDAISQKDYYALYGIIESSGYRLARFESLDRNRQIAADLGLLSRTSGQAIAKALADAARPATKDLAEYLLAAREALRGGPAFGSVGGAADVVFEDFESGTYAKWTTTGTAFGDRPQTAQTIASYQGKVNVGGKYFVNSHNIRAGGETAEGDAHTGRLTSKEFVVGRKYVTMLVGGGAIAGKTCVNLVIDGKAVRTATGRNDNRMYPVRWDVRELAGKTARIEVVDDGKGGWGNVGVDDIVFTDQDGPGALPKVMRAADFSEAFRARIAEAAKARKLDADVLSGWVEVLLRASRSADDPFAPWAKLCLDAGAEAPEPATPTKSAAVDVVIDYATSGPADWLPDEGSFGAGPVRPGTLRLVGNEPRFADYSAAEFDRAWDRIATTSPNDTGAIGKRVRAGRTIRTPMFPVKAGRVHYLVRGAGSAYAAVDGHFLIHGPLHGQLVTEFGPSPGFRWVTHDLTAYAGQPTHIEFTANDGDFAVAMVVQGEAPPATPQPVPDARPPAAIAADYQRMVANALDRWKASPPRTPMDARLANALLTHPAVPRNAIDPAVTAFIADRTKLAQQIVTTSRLAPALWEGNGFNEHLFIRGSPKGVGEEVPRRFLEALSGPKGIGGERSGRLELAYQMADPKLNPFVARVMVNRVWHHLFGRGIVGPVDNFGLLGEPPTHPELLDFLADRFVQDGWSLKRLIRDLVLSRTYRMSGLGDPAAAIADPQNLLLHRARLRRLDGEAIRDSMLLVSGRIDRTPFGPSVPIYLTPFLDGRGRPTTGPLDGDGRRSIYLSVKRNFLSPLLLAFDTPIPFSTVGRRQVSNVPAQSLILMNDPFVHQQAGVWSKKVLAGPGTTDDRLGAMYQVAFGRPPTPDETAACREFLTEQAGRYRATPADPRPWADLAHTLFNAKEFIYLD